MWHPLARSVLSWHLASIEKKMSVVSMKRKNSNMNWTRITNRNFHNITRNSVQVNRAHKAEEEAALYNEDTPRNFFPTNKKYHNFTLNTIRLDRALAGLQEARLHNTIRKAREARYRAAEQELRWFMKHPEVIPNKATISRLESDLGLNNSLHGTPRRSLSRTPSLRSISSSSAYGTPRSNSTRSF